jgi:hypothetical protein
MSTYFLDPGWARAQSLLSSRRQRSFLKLRRKVRVRAKHHFVLERAAPAHLSNLNESRILRTKNSTRLSVCEVPFSTTMDEGARRVETRLGVARAGKILRG